MGELPTFLSRLVPDKIEDQLVDILGFNTAATVLRAHDQRVTRQDMAKGITLSGSVEETQTAALFQVIYQAVSNIASERYGSLSELLGSVGDGRTLRLYKEKGGNGDLNLTISVAGQPDVHRTIPGVMGLDQGMDMRADTSEGFWEAFNRAMQNHNPQ
jgi:hypothetical protein